MTGWCVAVVAYIAGTITGDNKHRQCWFSGSRLPIKTKQKTCSQKQHAVRCWFLLRNAEYLLDLAKSKTIPRSTETSEVSSSRSSATHVPIAQLQHITACACWFLCTVQLSAEGSRVPQAPQSAHDTTSAVIG